MNLANKMHLPTRIPELDGIRGIAILLVVVYHAFVFSLGSQEGFIATLASYGFAGVDLFFVLSGFLITGILIDAKGHAAYFRNFYAKRALRIWPLYYLLLIISFGLVPLLIHQSQFTMGELTLLEGRSRLAYIFLVQNLWYPNAGGPTMLAMTWSLAIEEQFYIVWPWLVLWCSRKKLAWILGTILVLSPCLRLWARLHGVSGEAIYTVTCFRLDGLAFGALIALWCRSEFFSLLRAKWLGLSALAIGVPGSLWLLGGHFRGLQPLLYSALSVASAGSVTIALWFSQNRSAVGWPLRAGWLRYIGKISYCMYLVNQPIYYFIDSKLVRTYVGAGALGDYFAMIFGFGAILAVASLSWYLFESQMLKFKGRLEYHESITAAARVSG